MGIEDGVNGKGRVFKYRQYYRDKSHSETLEVDNDPCY